MRPIRPEYKGLLKSSAMQPEQTTDSPLDIEGLDLGLTAEEIVQAIAEGRGVDNTMCPVCSWSLDNPNYLLLHETEHWRVVLAPNQSLLGRSIVHLKRHCGDLADLTPDELLEWLTLVKTVENALRAAFDATMFNWSCYMNHAYRENPPEPHIHWWAVPRYNHPVQIDDRVFEDPQFGNPYDHNRWVEVPTELHHRIGEQVRQAIAQPDFS